MNYEKILVELIKHFVASEGTDYLAKKGEIENEFAFDKLSLEERTELSRLRDVAREEIGWHGY